MTKKISTIILGLISCSIALAQGGSNTYDFLNMTSSARVGALGGNQVGMNESDLNFVYHNPAALNKDLDGAITLNYVPYISGIKYGYAAYAHDFGSLGTFGIGVHSVNYGDFTRADENGNITGNFSSSEHAIMLNYSKQLSPKVTAGFALKPIISQFESYSSFGLAADLGLLYQSTDSLFSAGVTFKNAGSQLSTYNDKYEPLPYDLQVGISRKLRHAPFRISLTAQDLLFWKQSYTVSDGNGEEIIDAGYKGSLFNNVMRHMVLGLEFMPSDNFYIAAGYNHARRLDVGYEAKMSTVGFSWGFGFRVNRFNIAYGSAGYHLSGSSNHFTISTNLAKFKSR